MQARAAQPYAGWKKEYIIGRPDAGAPLDAIGGATQMLSAFSRWASVPPLLGLMSITPSSREAHAGPHWPMSDPGTSQQCNRHPTQQQQECAQGSNVQSLAPAFLEGDNSSMQAKKGSSALFTLAEEMHHWQTGAQGRLWMLSAVPHKCFQHSQGGPACLLCSDS